MTSYTIPQEVTDLDATIDLILPQATVLQEEYFTENGRYAFMEDISEHPDGSNLEPGVFTCHEYKTDDGFGHVLISIKQTANPTTIQVPKILSWDDQLPAEDQVVTNVDVDVYTWQRVDDLGDEGRSHYWIPVFDEE